MTAKQKSAFKRLALKVKRQTNSLNRISYVINRDGTIEILRIN